jgi:FMN phosphatase YigB (HAD superfamily)
MSAKAEAEAAAALRELGAMLKASTNAPKLHTLKVLNELGLDEEEDDLGEFR